MIGGKTKKDKSKSKIRLFSKYKTFKFERRNNEEKWSGSLTISRQRVKARNQSGQLIGLFTLKG